MEIFSYFAVIFLSFSRELNSVWLEARKLPRMYNNGHTDIKDTDGLMATELFKAWLFFNIVVIFFARGNGLLCYCVSKKSCSFLYKELTIRNWKRFHGQPERNNGHTDGMTNKAPKKISKH